MYISNIKWTKQQTSVLIKLLEQNSCLYDNQNPDYTNKIEREKSFHSICKNLGKSLRDVKVKIKILRGQYFKEKKAIVYASRINGVSIEEVYPKLWCYEALKFLDASVKGDPGTSNKIFRCSTIPNSSDDFISEKIVATKKRKARELEERAASALNIAQTLAERPSAGAEELFTRYLSAEIKNIKLDHILSKLKMDMLTLVHDAITNDKEEREDHPHFDDIIEYKEE